MLNFECLIYGFKSLIFGIPISTICVLLMFKLTHIEVELMKVFPWKSIIISTILVFTVVFISMIYAGKKICYNNPIDALKNDAI
jgi:putative ABC transport system permease protein